MIDGDPLNQQMLSPLQMMQFPLKLLLLLNLQWMQISWTVRILWYRIKHRRPILFESKSVRNHLKDTVYPITPRLPNTTVDPEKDENHYLVHRDRLYLHRGLDRGVLILRHRHSGDPDPDLDPLRDRGDYIMIHIIHRDRDHVHGTEWMSIHDTDSLAPDLLIAVMMIMAISTERGDTVIEIVIILHIVYHHQFTVNALHHRHLDAHHQ